MADPLTIISTVSSVASIVELLGKTVSALRALHSRWKEADFTLINLVGQLTALKTALIKLQEWMDTDMGEQHHQLVMDIDDSVACCSMLVRRMDSEIEELRQDSMMGLGTQNKIKLLLKNGTLEELQKMVDRQTSALTLLLTVCNCKAMSEQKVILEKTTSRKIFKRVKDDTSSLYVQRSSTSVYTYYTDKLSKISKVFEFDRELFTSKVYEKAVRGFLKDNVKNTRLQRQRNKLNRRILEEDAEIRRREFKTLLFGNPNCAQTLIKCMKIARPDCFTYAEREKYREIMHNNIIRVMESMIQRIKDVDIDLDDDAKMHVEILYSELKKIEAGDRKITIASACSVQYLWADKQFVKLFLDYKFSSPDSYLYLIKEIQRIAQEDYLPTDVDIFKLRNAEVTELGMQEYRFAVRSCSVRVLNASSQQTMMNMRISQSEDCIKLIKDIIGIIFLVDLGNYDEILPSKQIRILESLRLFDLVVNSEFYFDTPIVILFCNVGHFKESLKSKPLGSCFPCYKDGNDFNRASKYLLGRFNQVSRRKLGIDSRFCESFDIEDGFYVFDMLQAYLIRYALKDAGYE